MTAQKALKRRLRRVQVEDDRLLLEQRQAVAAAAAQEAARLNEDTRAAEIRYWQSWMHAHCVEGLDPLHNWLKALAADAGPEDVEPRDARREARAALRREPTDEELVPFVEDAALEDEFRTKYGRAPTWLEHVARFGREPCWQPWPASDGRGDGEAPQRLATKPPDDPAVN